MISRHTYRRGDLVLYQNYAIAEKFDHPFEYRWRGPVQIVYVSRKGKVNLRHLNGSNYVMKGWHTDKIRPYFLREDPVFK